MDKEPGDAEDSGSCCTECYSDEKAFTDIPPVGVAAIAAPAQTTENFVVVDCDESYLLSERSCCLVLSCQEKDEGTP